VVAAGTLVSPLSLARSFFPPSLLLPLPLISAPPPARGRCRCALPFVTVPSRSEVVSVVVVSGSEVVSVVGARRSLVPKIVPQ
jgi:hypothetical protein